MCIFGWNTFSLYDISSNELFSQERMLCKEIVSLMKEKGRRDWLLKEEEVQIFNLPDPAHSSKKKVCPGSYTIM